MYVIKNKENKYALISNSDKFPTMAHIFGGTSISIDFVKDVKNATTLETKEEADAMVTTLNLLTKNKSGKTKEYTVEEYIPSEPTWYDTMMDCTRYGDDLRGESLNNAEVSGRHYGILALAIKLLGITKEGTTLDEESLKHTLMELGVPISND